jgi:hypothetical protein
MKLAVWYCAPRSAEMRHWVPWGVLPRVSALGAGKGACSDAGEAQHPAMNSTMDIKKCMLQRLYMMSGGKGSSLISWYVR